VSDQTHVEEEYEEVGLGRYIAIAAVVAVVVAVGAFFAGRAAGSSSGPATLAAAVTQAQAGKLPCGASAQATPSAGGGTGAFSGGRPSTSFLVAAVCNRNGQTGFRRSGTGTGRGFGGGFAFGGPGSVAGRLTSVNGSTLTIQGRQGSQKVTLDGATTIRKYATGSKSDLKAGDSVIVSGGQNGAPRTVTVLPASQGQQ
jgi:hypothetical protein